MTRNDKFLAELESYLDEYEGLTPLPDPIRDAIRAELPLRKQVGSPATPIKYLRRSVQVPAPAAYGLVAAALVLAVVLGASLFAQFRNMGEGPSPTPAPEGTLINPGTGGAIAPGRYYIDDPFPVRVSFEVPQGISVDLFGYTSNASQLNLGTRGGGEVSFEIIDNVSADPCIGTLRDPPVGPSVDDLVAAISAWPDFNPTVPMDIVVDGFAGKQLTVTAPNKGCGQMQTWATSTRQNGVGPGEVNDVRILDVDGVRLLIGIAYQPSTTASDRSMLQAIVDSVELDR
jgi:hypothetical protein